MALRRGALRRLLPTCGPARLLLLCRLSALRAADGRTWLGGAAAHLGLLPRLRRLDAGGLAPGPGSVELRRALGSLGGSRGRADG